MIKTLLIISIISNIIQLIKLIDTNKESKLKIAIEVEKDKVVAYKDSVIISKNEEITQLKQQTEQLQGKIKEYESGEVISSLRKEIENVVTVLSAILK